MRTKQNTERKILHSQENEHDAMMQMKGGKEK